MPTRFRKLLSLGIRGWRDLSRAQIALLRSEWRLKRQPIGALAIRDASRSDEATGDPSRARELAAAVTRAASHGLIRPFCLARALALRALLDSHQIHGASIRVGVRRYRGEFQAHAWVVWREEILGDRPEHVSSFTEVDDLRVLRRP